MIKIVAKMHVKEGEVENFKALTKDLIVKSLAEEGNGGAYSLNVSLSDPQTLCFIEFWKDQAAIDAHNATEHFTGTFPKLAELCDQEPVVELFEEIEY